ncbi:hypothetical protein E4U31_007479 [Claviceps sp. LM219 group G6]|nr:hypothetical protein E4U31_007479 [Claviceps sp. LM219 group G6]
MSDHVRVMSEVGDEVADIVQEMRNLRQWQAFPDESITAQSSALDAEASDTEASDMEASDPLKEIPTSDPTYRHLSTNLIPHTRFRNMCLLEYQTFSGAMAFQPCALDVDLRGYFKAFDPIEIGGDPLFRIARSWSCMIQSFKGLPKEIRWVLATVYDFSNEMMRPDTSEETLWAMRQWLMYWFDMAERLFQKYNFPISAPDVDWFCRPTAVSVEDDQAVEVGSDTTLYCHDSFISDENRTVIHHRMESSPYPAAGYSQDAVPSSNISAWIAAQPDWATAFSQPLRPTPGDGIVIPRYTVSEPHLSASAWNSVGQERNSGGFRLNPEATEFDPHMELRTSPGSRTSRSPSPMSEDSIMVRDMSSELDGLCCSDRSPATSKHRAS